MPASAERKIKRQGGAARYRTLKKGGKAFVCAVTRKKGPEGGKTVCWEKESLGEGRDDLSKIPIPASAKRFNRYTSKSLGNSDWGNKVVHRYMDTMADLTNQQDRKNGFDIKDVGQPVKHSMKGYAEDLSAAEIVDALLEAK